MNACYSLDILEGNSSRIFSSSYFICFLFPSITFVLIFFLLFCRLMTNIILAGYHAINRPRLCRSDYQPNLLEYIDTTINESFNVNLTLTRTISNGYDQFGNTILDQYLLYLLCQKINPNRTDNLTNDFSQLLHRLIILNGKISKSFFEYSPPANNRTIYQAIFNSYTNFMWNEFDVNVLLELGRYINI